VVSFKRVHSPSPQEATPYKSMEGFSGDRGNANPLSRTFNAFNDTANFGQPIEKVISKATSSYSPVNFASGVVQRPSNANLSSQMTVSNAEATKGIEFR
jgi:hypothetical protein